MKFLSRVKWPFAIFAIALFSPNAFGQTTQTQYLSGAGNDDTVEWEFMVTGGRKSGQWARIAVPSNWEMQGFGAYRYHDDWSNDPAPDNVGYYRHRFTVPRAWQGKKVDIIFGGSMTDTEVKINGSLAGPAHQGGFYQFRYDITDLLRYDRENLLEVKVAKYSSNTSVNRAERKGDYWLFGGIFRPVWLEAFPPQRIERAAIDARHTGEFSIDIFLDGIASAGSVAAQIF
ncbi:MAG TPA: sugar-binding domain-containing protein [Blastocatellia bacterium]